ncbi:MAG: putative toxin-antitoxin system toxin component, PIN family [Clostridiales Family XIII bacterium]|nr:putative toxin-antitoxin system toxin component, PIN family [Clostridiales Family XIII bacterium]
MRHRVVLDTNVIVSAMLSPGGKPARALDLVLTGNAVLCHDSRILLEYESVLTRRKFGFDHAKVRNLMILFMEMGLAVIASPTDMVFADESDRKFYETALSSGAVLVTGNIKHFPNAPWIVSPAEYIKECGVERGGG